LQAAPTGAAFFIARTVVRSGKCPETDQTSIEFSAGGIMAPLAMPPRASATGVPLVYLGRMANPTNPAIAHLYSGRATGVITRVAPGTKNFVPRFPRPASRQKRPRNTVSQAVIAVAGLAICLVLGVLGADQIIAYRAGAAAKSAVIDQQIYIGSILFYPDNGRRCHQLYFNNRDGEYSDKGLVDCTRAISELSKDAPKSWSAGRTAEISKSFQ
jgi:hypothetical protein